MTTYADEIAKGLTRVYTQNSVHEGVELADMRMVIVSDLHKGQRDRADDFLNCEQTYLAAADHYWADQYELLLLGDIEELWECWPEPVIREYQDVLLSEQRFADTSPARRYKRFVGNHDDVWYFPDQVKKHLGPYLGGNPVIEGLRLTVHEQGEPLGELFLLHGHQGTLDSDRFAGLSALGGALRVASHPAHLQHQKQHAQQQLHPARQARAGYVQLRRAAVGAGSHRRAHPSPGLGRAEPGAGHGSGAGRRRNARQSIRCG